MDRIRGPPQDGLIIELYDLYKLEVHRGKAVNGATIRRASSSDPSRPRPDFDMVGIVGLLHECRGAFQPIDAMGGTLTRQHLGLSIVPGDVAKLLPRRLRTPTSMEVKSPRQVERGDE